MKQSDKDMTGKMKIIGVTGGVGSGKSRVLTYLEENHGAYVCRLDDVAKELQKKGGECYFSVVEAFGTGILDECGEIDRRKLAEMIFRDENKRQMINALVHPAVKRHVKEDIEKKSKAGVSLYVIESALLPEAGYEEICSQLWYIYAREDVRRKRLSKTRGYSDEKTDRIIKSQSSEKEYEGACGVCIDNSGDFKDTIRQIGEHL